MNQIRINVFGDFVAPNIKNLIIGDNLSKIINNSDYNIINFEAPIKSDGLPIKKSGPNNEQNTESPYWIENNKFNIVALANNHIMDFGNNGYYATISKFKTAKIIGAGKWDDAYKPLIINNKGHSIAIMALTHLEFGVLTDPYEKKIGCAWINHPCVDVIINNLKNRVDYIIIVAHAGIENIEHPLPEWRERYKALIDLGCDAIIASHPHIPQGWEIYKNKPICYSLGNFYFPKKESKPWFWYHSICASLILNHGNVTLEINPISSKYNYIDTTNNNDYIKYLKRINNELSNEDIYINYINKKSLELLPHYNYLFYKGGLMEIKLSLNVIKRLIKRLFNSKEFGREHLLNNLQCESHRWIIIRALKNLNDTND